MTVDKAGALLFGSGGGGVGGDVDERAAAQAALDAAEERLQSLCASHAGTFVGVERRWRSTERNLNVLLARIASAQEQVSVAARALDPEDGQEDDLQEDSSDARVLPSDGVEKPAKDRSASLAYLSEQHRLRRRTLLQHSSLLELLELPSLMDACVRSSLYEEALSIAAFANTLERRHGGGAGPGADTGIGVAASVNSNAVVTRVIQQIRGRQDDLRRHLLDRLRSHVTMPVCLEVVTALRRLNSIDLERRSATSLEKIHTAMEFTLQVEFLEARDAWLESSPAAAAALPASLGPMQPTEQLLDAIERYRTRVFEVATQFNAIFRAQVSNETAAASMSILSMWLGRRIHAFLALLSSQLLIMEDTASLRDALEASVFFATSMGRLGADFTPQLGPLFEPRMLALVTKQWKDGAAHLTETLSACRQAQVNFPLVAIASSGGTTDTPAAASISDFAVSDADGSVVPPPRLLLKWPPLARFINAVLSGLNELRRCLLPGIFSSLTAELEQVLTSARAELVAHERAVLVPGFRGEAVALRETAARYLQLWDELVAPYLRGSLRTALGLTGDAEFYYQVLRNNAAKEKAGEVSNPEPASDQIDLTLKGDSPPQDSGAKNDASPVSEEQRND